MPQSSTRLVAIRILFLAGVIQGLALACDGNGPTGPDKNSQLAPPNSPAYGLVPGGFTASPVAFNQISLSWSPVPSATGYQVFRSTTGAAGTYSILSPTLATTRYQDFGLTASTEYCYEVRSAKNAGRTTSYSALSAPACATTLPPPVAAPSETDAAPQGSNVVIKWKDNSDNEDGFHVQRAPLGSESWLNAVDVAANATSASVFVSAEQPTCFRVIAFNAVGPSNASTPDCTTVPATPSSLSAKITGPQTVTLQWTDNSTFEDGFKISRSANGGTWTDIVSLPASTLPYPNNTVTYQDASVSPDVSYRYVVTALKDGGVSNVSNQATVLISTTVPTTPGPAGVAWFWDNEGYGWNYLYISWSDLSNNEAGFRVEYSADGKTDWSLFYTAEADANSLYLQYSVFGAPAAGGCYRVIAFNNVGDSGASDIACIEPGVYVSDLTATAIDQQEIDLTWTDISALETNYVVLRSTDPYSGYYDVVATTDANATSYQDKGLASGQDYFYLVVAVYPGGTWGDYSNGASATTTAAAGLTPSLSVGTVLAGPTPRTAVRVRGVKLPVRPHKDAVKAPRKKK